MSEEKTSGNKRKRDGGEKTLEDNANLDTSDKVEKKSRKKVIVEENQGDECSTSNVDMVQSNEATDEQVQEALEALPDTDMIRFTHPESLKIFIEMVNGILDDCCFEMVKSEKQNGLSIATMDEKQVCMIAAHISGVVKLKLGADPFFIVKTATMNTLLRSVPTSAILDLIRGGDDLKMRAKDSTGSISSEFTLATLAKEGMKNQLAEMVSSHVIQIDLNNLKALVKLGKDLKSPYIEIILQEPLKEKSPKLKNTYVWINGKGDATFKRCFHSQTETQQDTKENETIDSSKSSLVVIKSSPVRMNKKDLSVHELSTVYKEKFSTDYLSMFLRGMDQKSICLQVKSGQPLILKYPLGSDSDIQFVLAPKEKEEDETETGLGDMDAGSPQEK